MGRDTGVADRPTLGGVDGKGQIGRVDGAAGIGELSDIKGLSGGVTGLDGKGGKKVDRRDKASGLSVGGFGDVHGKKAHILNASNLGKVGDLDIDGSGALQDKGDKKVSHLNGISDPNVSGFGDVHGKKARILNTNNLGKVGDVDISGSDALQGKGGKKVDHLDKASSPGGFGNLGVGGGRASGVDDLDIGRSGGLDGKGDIKVGHRTSNLSVGGFKGVGGGRDRILNTNNPDKVGDLNIGRSGALKGKSGKKVGNPDEANGPGGLGGLSTGGFKGVNDGRVGTLNINHPSRVDGLGTDKSDSLSGKGGSVADTLAGHHAKVGGLSGDGARDGSDGLNGKGGEGIGNLVTHPSKADC